MSWRNVRLGDLVEPIQTWDPARHDASNMFEYIDLSSIDQESKTISSGRTVSCGEAPSRARQMVAVGDTLVSTVRPNLNGVARVPHHLNNATASTGFCVLRPNLSLLDGNYLFHWVKHPDFISNMTRQAIGVNYPAVSDKIIKWSHIPLPSLPEQRRIASALDQSEALLAKRREALGKLDGLLRSIFLDFYEEVKEVSSCLSLVNTVEATRGSFVNGPFGSDLLTSELQEEGVPVIYIRDIRNGEYRRVSAAHVSTEKARVLAVSSVNPGDVLVAKVGDPPGIAAIYPQGEEQAVVTQDVIRLRLDADLALPEFIVHFINSPIGRLRINEITVSATRARFSLRDFKKLSIELPSLDLQRKFALQIKAVERSKSSHRAHLAELDVLFASLQHRAFRGEL